MPWPLPPGAVAELTGERTRFSKKYATATPGQYGFLATPGPMHFPHKTGGAWTDMDQLVSDLGGNVWETNAAGIQFRISQNDFLQALWQGFTVTFRAASLVLIDRSSPNNRRQTIASASLSAPTYTALGEHFRWTNLFPNVDLELVVRDTGVKELVTIKADLGLPDPASLGWNPATTVLVVAFTFVGSPRSLTELDNPGVSFSGTYFGQNALCLRDAQGTPQIVFPRGTTWGELLGRDGTHESPVWFVRTPQIDFGIGIDYRITALGHYPLYIDPTLDTDLTASANDGQITYDYYDTVYGVSDNGSSFNAGHYYYNDGKGTIDDVDYRGFLRWDLSSISASATLVSGYVRVYSHSNGAGSGSITIYLKLLDSDWGTLDSSDWSITGTDQDSITSDTWGTGAANDWDLTSGIEAKFGGYAAFRLYANNEGSGTTTRYIIFRSYDYGSERPHIYINYSESTPSAAGASSLPHLVAAGTATAVPAATGAGSLPHLVAAGVGVQTFSGAAAASLPRLVAAGTATATAGAGAASLPHLVAAGTATGYGGVTPSADGASTLPGLVASGVAYHGQIIQPSGTTAAGNWTAEGGATLHGVTSDRSESSWAQLLATDDPSAMTLSVPTVDAVDAGDGALLVRWRRT